MIKYLYSLCMLFTLSICVSSCSEESLNPKSIFEIEFDKLDPSSSTYKFDKWLLENYLKEYNLQFRYKLQDVGADMDYNLVPATYDKSIDLAVLTKYLWFDVYKDVVDPEFLKMWGPKIIHIIGSPAYNPANHTMILGLAEGGLKVSLFRVNSIDVTDFNMLNEFYFKTMHHEFAHIMHQTKTYPPEFKPISLGKYEPLNWQDRNYNVVASLGFTSPYASSEEREDFAETIANFITMTDAQWKDLMYAASKSWIELDFGDTTAFFCYYYYKDNDKLKPKIGVKESDIKALEAKGIIVYDVTDNDGVDGEAIILQKVGIAREWLRDAWNIDFDALRAEVQKRQVSINMDELRKPINEMK